MYLQFFKINSDYSLFSGGLWGVAGSWVAAWPPEQGRTVDPLDCRWSVVSGDGVELPEPGGWRLGAAPLLPLLPAALRTPPVGVSDQSGTGAAVPVVRDPQCRSSGTHGAG